MTVRIELRDRDNIESALRRLRRICRQAGIPRGRRARTFFETRGEKCRRKTKDRIRTIRKAESERT